MEALQERSLASNTIYAQKDRNGPLSANQVTSRDEPMAMLFAPFGCTHPSPLSRPFCWSRTYLKRTFPEV